MTLIPKHTKVLSKTLKNLDEGLEDEDADEGDEIADFEQKIK